MNSKLKIKNVFFFMNKVFFSKKFYNKEVFIILGKDNYFEIMFIRRLLIDFIVVERNFVDFDKYYNYIKICLTKMDKKPYIKYTRPFLILWKDINQFISIYSTKLCYYRYILLPKLLVNIKNSILLDNFFSIIISISFLKWRRKRNIKIRKQDLLRKRYNEKNNKKII